MLLALAVQADELGGAVVELAGLDVVHEVLVVAAGAGVCLAK